MTASIEAAAAAVGSMSTVAFLTIAPITGDTTINLQTVVAVLVCAWGVFKVVRRNDVKLDAIERSNKHQWKVISLLVKKIFHDQPEVRRMIDEMEEQETTVK